jgi:hypothetical protein
VAVLRSVLAEILSQGVDLRVKGLPDTVNALGLGADNELHEQRL